MYGLAVDMTAHLDALERLRKECDNIVGCAAELSSTGADSEPSDKMAKTAVSGADFHISLSHTQPAAFTQRRTLIQGLRKACVGWHPLNLTLDSVQVTL